MAFTAYLFWFTLSAQTPHWCEGPFDLDISKYLWEDYLSPKNFII